MIRDIRWKPIYNTDQQILERARRIEERHVNEVPQGEAEEIREIFRRKGFDGELLERVVDVITADRKLWIDTMLKEEWGLSLHGPSPTKAAMMTFAAFVCVGLIPLSPFFTAPATDGLQTTQFAVSAILTAAAFFGVGMLKSAFATGRWFRSGLETLLMGGGAAVLAWLVGVALRGLA